MSKELAELTKQLSDKLRTKLSANHNKRSHSCEESTDKPAKPLLYTPKSKVTEDYRAFIEEFLEASEERN